MRTAAQKERRQSNSATKNLIKLMNLGPTGAVDVVRTSDGFYLGQAPGDIGYNMFIGRPSPVHEGPGLEHTLAVWESLTVQERNAVRMRCNHPLDGERIPLSDFGIE